MNIRRHKTVRVEELNGVKACSMIRMAANAVLIKRYNRIDVKTLDVLKMEAFAIIIQV